jgi:hypothetical protein
LLILGALFGIKVLIAGIVLFYWSGYAVGALYSKRLIAYSVNRQFLDFLPLMGIAFIPAILTWGIGIVFSLSPFILLVIQFVTYPCLVVALSVLFRVSAFFEIKNILADKLTLANFLKTFNL